MGLELSIFNKWLKKNFNWRKPIQTIKTLKLTDSKLLLKAYRSSLTINDWLVLREDWRDFFLFWKHQERDQRQDTESKEGRIRCRFQRCIKSLENISNFGEQWVWCHEGKTRPAPISRVRDIDNLRWLLLTQDDLKWLKTTLND